MESDAVCIANIGPRERRRRLFTGFVGVALGVVVGAALVVSGAHRLYRLLAFIPFEVGALGVLQARAST
jgi:hypothetical protein